MEASRISTASLLPDEMILQILSNLSLKNLHRLKWVSKSWFSLITKEVLPKLVKSPNLSFYYSNYRRCTPENKSSVLFDFLPNNDANEFPENKSSVLFDFLPNNDANEFLENKSSVLFDFLPNNDANEFPILTILDCCGGLVFCSLCDDEIDPLPETTYYYICNPVDKSYNQILTPFPNPLFFMLDFNPSISPHYKVIVGRWGDPSRDLLFGIYDSKKCCFETVHVHHQHVSYIILGRRYSALWNGNVYLHCTSSIYSSTGPQRRIGSEGRTMMISGILGGLTENIICEFITFPKQSMVITITSSSYMGAWRDRLRFVNYDDHEIRIWALWDTQEDEWTLEHICACSFCSIECSSDDIPPNVVGLHPLQNAVLFMFKNLLFVYDLDQMIFEKICEIGDDAILEVDPIRKDDAMLSTEQLVFPFSPCIAKEVLL